MLTQIGDLMRWLAAVPVGMAPRRWWPALERHLPLHRAAAVSGLATLVAGFFLGFGGFMTFATRLAGANNDWMMARLAGPPQAGDAGAGLVPYGISVLTLFSFLLFTPLGLFASYLGASGLVRAIGAWVDEPSGDFALTGLDWALRTLWQKNRRERTQIARARREGIDAPDVLRTGTWAGIDGADYVVLASRRKSEWTAGAIILTSSDWYKLGVPFDMETPRGLRTAYPLTRMDTVEVVRRGIEYELPALRDVRSKK